MHGLKASEESLVEKKTNMASFTIPETNIAHENPHLSWKIPFKWWIFHGYVSLQEFEPF